MPRGIRKTNAERRKEYTDHQKWVERRLKERPPRSPCRPGRIYHRFRSNKTRGPLNVKSHGDEKCWWCGKTFAQVKQEQKEARERRKKTNPMISDIQAEILGSLLLYDELRQRMGGYFFYSTAEKVDGRSLLGLLKRGLIITAAYHTAPSIGHLASPVFLEDSVTDEGKEALKRYLDSVSYYEKKRHRNVWMRKLEERGIE